MNDISSIEWVIDMNCPYCRTNGARRVKLKHKQYEEIWCDTCGGSTVY